ncbi:hypothetical protein [Methylocaldum sp. RMAD-M]|jgi:hypothetical protein|uniref:hypothetical protein n=1 Tax=Methylocaldum sp. RMAD-M TaxID=2806557 RepID=UPI001AE5E79B|nr:hypothetical protein [Methylocaldum sp. RMAD-M]
MITEDPYEDDFIGIEPYILQDPAAWCAHPGTRRPVQFSKSGRQILSDCENSSGSC